jgi:hypothetical protein
MKVKDSCQKITSGGKILRENLKLNISKSYNKTSVLLLKE